MVEKNMFTAMDKKTLREIAENIHEELNYYFPQLDNKVSVVGREIEIMLGTHVMECGDNIDYCKEQEININGKISTDTLEIEIYPKKYETDYSIIGLGITIVFKNGDTDGYMVSDIIQLIRGLISIYR